jgi:predicted MFS family arabinose efflux permease
MSKMSRHAALAPFRIRSFRFQWPADLLTSWAFEMETLILGWYVLVETGSVLLLTVLGALGYGGTLIAPMLGIASDRIGHRAVLVAMRAVYAAVAATLMILAFAGALSALTICVLAAVTGIVRPSDIGLRGALIAETMPFDRLTGAMGISRTTSDSARIAGALLGAGLFAAFGVAAAYLVVTSFYVLGTLLTLGVEPTSTKLGAETPAADARKRSSPRRELADGLAQIWRSPSLLAVVWLALLFNSTAFPITNGLLPYVAREIYQVDQTGLAYLTASFAGGALVGSLTVSRAAMSIELPRLTIFAAFAWYGLLLVFAHMHSLSGGVASLVLAGFAQSMSMVSHSVILLRACEPRFRGRVTSVRTVAIYGLPLGLVAAGTPIGRIGFPATATLYAVTGLVFTAAVALRWRAALRRLHAAANR